MHPWEEQIRSDTRKVLPGEPPGSRRGPGPTWTAHAGRWATVGYVVQMNGIPIAVTRIIVTQVEPIRAGSLYCGEARRLLDALADAIHELVQIHEQQFNAIIQGDLDYTGFDLSIFEANKAKDAAKYAYLGHLEEHRCSTLGSEATVVGS